MSEIHQAPYGEGTPPAVAEWGNSLPADTPVPPAGDREEEARLLETVTSGKGKPLNRWELTALLETNGLRDVDARQEWQEPDLFSLPQRLFRHLEGMTFSAKSREVEKIPLALRILKNYLKGTMFALPMMIQIVSMLVVGFGIWSYVNFSLRQATAIAAGTLIALSITGGISQIIGRKGLYYLKMDELVLASKVTKRLYLLGVIQVIVLGLVSLLLNWYFRLFPSDMILLYLMYCCLLSFVFLSFAIFYMFENFGTIALLVLGGIICVYLCFAVFRIPIFTSQALGMILLILVSNLLIAVKLRRIERKSFSEGIILPNSASLFYSLYPYFIFGTAYFLFIIMDRLLAWTTGREFLPYFFWFNYPYEVGVDWALIPLVFTLSLVEVFIHELGYLAFDRICRVKAAEVRAFNNYFVRIYFVAAVSFAVVGIVSISVASMFPLLLKRLGYAQFLQPFYNPTDIFVFSNASVGYVLLSWSLLNCIIFFSYSRPEFALKSIGLAVTANVLTGYIFSRSIDYYYSVVGLLVGSIVFAAVSTYFALRLFRNYDYYYYSSY